MPIRQLRSLFICTRLHEEASAVHASGHKAGARLLVAAMTMTWALFWKPSISDSIWFSVWSRSSFPWAPPRVRPTASISSMKMMAGARVRACIDQENASAGLCTQSCKNNWSAMILLSCWILEGRLWFWIAVPVTVCTYMSK